MTEKIELDLEDVELEHIPAEEFNSRKDDAFRLRLRGQEDSTWIDISKAEYFHLKGVLE